MVKGGGQMEKKSEKVLSQSFEQTKRRLQFQFFLER